MNASTVTATIMAKPPPRHFWWGLAGLWALVLGLFFLLYFAARRTAMDEIRAHAMGTAIAIGAALDPGDLARIHGPEDLTLDCTRKIQAFFLKISASNPDIRYLYVMRRSQKPGAGASAYEYIVDMSAMDLNANGVIDTEEGSEAPGTAYDASDLPALIKAWGHPDADEDLTADPPYPDLISGYAPIKDDSGITVGVMGADVTARTVSRKLLTLRLVMLAGALVTGILLTIILGLLFRQTRLLHVNRTLGQELKARNQMLRSANDQLVVLNQRYEEELKLAQNVQMGFLPKHLPRSERIAFDKCFVTCALLGGDLYDVFSVDEHRLALCVADVSGHGASAALISGLLKMALESLKHREGSTTAQVCAHPGQLLHDLNALLVKEMPEDKFVTLVYAVFDMEKNTCRLASAGHPLPLRFEAARRAACLCEARTGPAIGLYGEPLFPETTWEFASGDKILFYSDGLTEAMDCNQNEFGEEQFVELIGKNGDRPAPELMQIIESAIAKHRGGSEINDDFTLLITEIR